jgi:hypothetical protein
MRRPVWSPDPGRPDADFVEDVDRTEVAGWHPVKRLGITVNIRQQEIEIRKDDPHGRSMVVEFSPLAGLRSYGIGSFYPSEDEA